jgi:2-succinyl-6-hydroxy-2,4-cyclohexadiene-1-carboxylate synthase
VQRSSVSRRSADGEIRFTRRGIEEDPSLISTSGLRYVASGAPGRPAVVFLHGFLGSSADWKDTTAALGAGAFCVAVDLPGHGASVGLPPAAYTFEGAARRVLGVLDDLGLERATFAGYSMGGRLALYLALHHPGRCEGLFLESASPGLEHEGERAARRAADEEKARRLEMEDLEEFLRDWYRQPLFASLARDERLLERTIEARLRNDPLELAKSLRGMGTGSQPSLWGELKGLGAPALTTAGELDAKFVGTSRRMASLAPRMRIAVVPGAGHNVRAEVPEAYLTLLEGLLGSP